MWNIPREMMKHKPSPSLFYPRKCLRSVIRQAAVTRYGYNLRAIAWSGTGMPILQAGVPVPGVCPHSLIKSAYLTRSSQIRGIFTIIRNA